MSLRLVLARDLAGADIGRAFDEALRPGGATATSRQRRARRGRPAGRARQSPPAAQVRGVSVAW